MTLPPHPLTNFEIQEYYQNEPRFNGAFSRDNLPNSIKNGAYVINLDEYRNIGTHWIALYVNNKTIIYFDSFGVEHIPKEIIKFIGNNKKIITNIYRIQAYDSIMCGYFWVLEGSSDKYLVVAKSVRNKDIIGVLDTVWGSIENKIEDKINPIPNNYPSIKIKDYDKFRFNSDIDLPLDTSIEFHSLVINVSCVIEKDDEYYPEIYLDECLYVKGNAWPATT